MAMLNSQMVSISIQSIHWACCPCLDRLRVHYMVYHGAYSQGCQTYLGSRDYRAPEVVRLGINRKKTSGDQGGYGKPADMWSLGAPLIRNLASPECWFSIDVQGDHSLSGALTRSIRSKGVVVYVMLSGERAFESQSKVEVESLGSFS